MNRETKSAKIAFVGCGGHATGNLYPAIHTIPEIDLVAVCDQKKELAERNARNFGARRLYTDLDAMFKQEKLDGAIVVGPPQMHYEIGKRCLDAGLPIFVEKPSALTYEAALELAEYAQKRNLYGAMAFMKRSSTAYRMAKGIASKKEFGRPTALEVRFCNGRYPAIWGIKEPERAYLIGQAVHIFDLIRFFGGDVSEIYAALNVFQRHKSDNMERANFAYAISVRFKDGAVGVMNMNACQGPGFQMSEYFMLAGMECWLEVRDMVELNYHANSKPMPELINPLAGYGTMGRAQIFQWRPEFTEYLGGKAEGTVGYTGELQNFARKILGLDELRANLFDGAKALQIAEAIWESSQSGKTVKIK
ncbi:MAG: Gfo/Idh/MocA family oxidoreductase [Kiritimatiellae bacterium]|nr:Gfo/Idh/MocA family oxidoreductase [Kiritimatiellia bacterium]